MQPALNSQKIPILREVKKAVREKFQKHQNRKMEKIYDSGIVGKKKFSSEYPTEYNV